MTSTLDDVRRDEPGVALEDGFEATLARHDRIEPRDWMPEGYRATLVRQIAQHAHSEIIGMQPEGNWITRAPSLRRKAILLAKVQDEAGHGLYLYSACETLGRLAPELTEMLDRRRAEVLLDLQLPDAVVRRRRHHRLAGRRRRDLQPGAAVPHLLRALRPRDDPDLQGGVLPPAAGLRAADDDDGRHRRAARDGPGVGGPVLVAVADDVRPARRRLAHTEQSMAWGIKRNTNDELRQRFVDMTVPQAEALGVTLPDPDLRWNEERRAPRLRRARLGRVLDRGQGRRPLQRPAHRPPAGRAHEERRLGARGGDRPVAQRRGRAAGGAGVSPQR